jgi:hypothetical protein
VLACIQDSQHRLFSVSQYQRLLALFTVFIYAINEIIRQENLLSSSLADLVTVKDSHRNMQKREFSAHVHSGKSLLPKVYLDLVLQK